MAASASPLRRCLLASAALAVVFAPAAAKADPLDISYFAYSRLGNEYILRINTVSYINIDGAFGTYDYVTIGTATNPYAQQFPIYIHSLSVDGSTSTRPGLSFAHVSGPIYVGPSLSDPNKVLGDVNGDTAGIVVSTDGQITIRAGNVTAAHADGNAGISATTGVGSIDITAANVEAMASAPDKQASGIVASTLTGGITIGGSGSTTANGTGRAIDARVTLDTAVSTITITRSGTITAADGDAIYAENEGKGDIVIRGLGAVMSTGGSAIVAMGGGNVTIGSAAARNIGDISGGATGIVAQATGSGGAVSVLLSASVTGGGTAVSLLSKGGAISVDGAGNVNPGLTGSDNRSGITASSETGSIEIKGSGATAASGSGDAIYAHVGARDTVTGGITITRSGTITAQRGDGISARNDGSGNITIAGLGGVSSIGGRAISASTNGNIFIGTASANTGAISGASEAIRANSAGGDITIRTQNSVNATGLTDSSAAQPDPTYGVYAKTSGSGQISVTADSGTSSTTIGVAPSRNGQNTYGIATGIYAETDEGMITIGGSSSVNAGASANRVRSGIVAQTTTGGISISGSGATAGTATGRGIDAQITGANATTDILVTRSGDVTSASGAGIYAENRGAGKIDIRAGNVTTSSAVAAIVARTGGGAIDITVATGKSVTGAGNYAILVGSYQGPATVRNSGTITGSVGALRLYKAQDGSLVTDSGQTASTTAPTFTLANAGVIKLAASSNAISGFTVTNQAGGVLTGAGHFGTVVANQGSVLQPGDGTAWSTPSAPTQMAVGTLTMNSGSTLRVRANLANGALTGDSLLVTDAAEFKAGSILDVVATPRTDTNEAKALWRPGASYEVIKLAGSATGSLKDLPTAQTDLAFLKPSVASKADGRAVLLTLALKTSNEALAFLTTLNQRAVAGALLGVQGGATPSADGQALIDRFNNLGNTGAGGTLDQLSGQSNSGGTQAVFNGSTLVTSNVLTQALVAGGLQQGGAPAIRGGGSPLGYAAVPDETAAVRAVTPKDARPAAAAAPVPATWRVWATGLGAQSTSDARGTSPRLTGNDWGLAAGFDYVFGPTFTGGGSFAGTSSRFSVAQGQSTGTTEGAHVSIYGVAQMDAAYLAASLGYGRLTTRGKRNVSPFGTLERYAGRYDTDSFAAQAEIGYRLSVPALGRFSITPFAGLQVVLARHHAYAETAETAGAISALAYRAQDTRSVPAQLGLQAEQIFALDGGWSLGTQARGAWVHAFSTERRATSSFVVLPGSTFSVSGVRPVENLARITGSATLANDKGLSLFTTINADVARTTRTYSAQAGMKVAW